MSDFIYDGSALPYPKTDLTPEPGGADPTKYVAAVDWNTVAQGLVDARTAILAGKYHSVTQQSSTPPLPANFGATIFCRSNGLSTPNTRTQLCVVFSDGTILVLGESGTR